MRNWIFLTVPFITLFSLGSHAATGVQLYSLCQDGDPACAGYIKVVSGILDGGHPVHGNSACIPNGVGIDQLTDVSVRWMEENPQKMSASSTEIIARALSVSFPCE